MNSPYIRTVTGRKFYPLDPRPEDVCIEDIAHALAKVPRWGGHTEPDYSVALHSIHVSRMVSPENAITALLHDATEAYICDIPKPIKSGIPGYEAIEAQLNKVLAVALGFKYPFPEEVKQADAAALYQESQHFFPLCNDVPFVASPLRNWPYWDLRFYSGYPSGQAREAFLYEYASLKERTILESCLC